MAETPKKAEPAIPAKASAPAKKLDAACLEFLWRFNISPEAFAQSGYEWEVLKRIRAAHIADSERLAAVVNPVVELLRGVPAVHSLKVREKDPDHLIAKVIRKRLLDPALDVTEANYRDHITDLVGVRALHLFKDDWRLIHEFVMVNWEPIETPLANVRKGDAEEPFAESGCEVKTHELGYRSVHYLLRSQPTKAVNGVVELQVRTLFEEGWSEIDHLVRYPYGENEPVLSQFLDVFNRLAGSADEMGTFIKVLRQSVEKHREAVATKESELKATIAKLNLAEEAKRDLQSQVDDLTKSSRYSGPMVAVQGSAMSALSHTLLAYGLPTAVAAERNYVATSIPLAALTGGAPNYATALTHGAGLTSAGFTKVCKRCGHSYTENLLSSTVLTVSDLCPSCRTSATALFPR